MLVFRGVDIPQKEHQTSGIDLSLEPKMVLCMVQWAHIIVNSGGCGCLSHSVVGQGEPAGAWKETKEL